MYLPFQDFKFSYKNIFTGNSPSRKKGTIIHVPICDKLKSTEWGSSINLSDPSNLVANVMVPNDACVGVYDVKTEFATWEGDTWKLNVKRQPMKDKIIVLFNPWCKGNDIM